jgi:quercetin dioxygenase-like cupin family protein
MDERQRIAISEFVSDRTPRPLTGPLLSFDLANEVALLRDEPIWHSHGHNARTLIKQPDFRLVLISLRAGKQVHERDVEEPIAVQPLQGRLRVEVNAKAVDLGPQQLVSIGKNVPYAFEAVEDCAFLLWVGWSKA